MQTRWMVQAVALNLYFRVRDPTCMSKVLGFRDGYSITAALQETLIDVAIQEIPGLQSPHKKASRMRVH